MPFTKKEHEQIEIAKKFPAAVLIEAVKYQAGQSVFSEAGCLECKDAFAEAAQVARARRLDYLENPKRPIYTGY